MKLIEVYVDDTGRPCHLAVPNEHTEGHRAVCGAKTLGMTTRTQTANDVRCGCVPCDDQLKMLLDTSYEI